MSKDENRRFPMKTDFLSDKKLDDIMYGFLLSNSYLTNDNRRYCIKADVTAGQMIKYFKEQDKKIASERKLRDMFKLFMNIDLLSEGEYDKKKVYFIPDLDGKDGRIYVRIKIQTLKFLVDTANSNVIKIYAYLKMMMEIHNKRYTTAFRFAEKDLLEQIGFKTINYSNNYAMIRNILDSLRNNGLIEFHKEFVKTDCGIITEYFYLDKVNEDYISFEKPVIEDNTTCAVAVETPKAEAYEFNFTVGIDPYDYRF